MIASYGLNISIFYHPPKGDTLLNFTSKTFSQLTSRELYEILRARETVFLLEQRIVCQDLDRIDYDALHCFLCDKDGALVAYLRAYADDAGVKLGRVLTLRRGEGIGAILMNNAIPAIKGHFKSDRLYIHSQKHAEGFYARFGFVSSSEDFMEEGVPHVLMKYNS